MSKKRERMASMGPTPRSASPSSGTVPEIKIIKNMESTHVEHVNSHAHTSERLSPKTENLMTTQRPFSAHSHITGSPTASRRLIYGRPRPSTMEKDWCFFTFTNARFAPFRVLYSGTLQTRPLPPGGSLGRHRRTWLRN